LSRFSHEHGTIKFSSRQYSKFRRKILEAWNRRQKMMFDVARKLYTDMRKCRRTADQGSLFLKTTSKMPRFMVEPIEDALNVKSRPPLWRPVHALFPKVATSRGIKLWVRRDWVSVEFDDNARTMEWRVEEVDHAVALAHDDSFVKFMFQELECVPWTRGNGGSIFYQDEGGRREGLAPMVKYHFGPEPVPCPNSV
jgi:hypothetical protein